MAQRVVSVVEMAERLDELGERLPMALGSALRAHVELLARHVQREKMSGQYLGVVTGTARRSIATRYSEQPGRLVGEFGSPLRYVRAHELGFSGAVHVPARTVGAHRVRAHTRTTARGAVRVRSHDRAAHVVTAHDRNVKIRAKHFFRDTLAERGHVLDAYIQRALAHLLETGSVPTPDQVAP